MAQQATAQERFNDFLSAYTDFRLHSTKADAYLRAKQDLARELRSTLRRPNQSPHTIARDLPIRQRRILGDKALDLFNYDEERADSRELATMAAQKAEGLFRTLGYHGVSYTPLNEAVGRSVAVRAIGRVHREPEEQIEGIIGTIFDIERGCIRIVNQVVYNRIVAYDVPLLVHPNFEPAGSFVISEETAVV